MIIFERLAPDCSGFSKYRILRQDPEDYERFTEHVTSSATDFEIVTRLGTVWVYSRAFPQFEGLVRFNYLYLRGTKRSGDDAIILVPNSKAPLVELVMSVIGRLKSKEQPLPTLEES